MRNNLKIYNQFGPPPPQLFSNYAAMVTLLFLKLDNYVQSGNKDYLK